MANVSHASQTGSNLHENKGVASASDNTVATASSGATVWQKLTASHLTGTGNPFGGQLFHVREQQAAGTSSTTSPVIGSYVTATLNTSVTNEISGASLGVNQISLPAGTYFVVGWGMVSLQAGPSSSALMKAKLYNVTTSADLVMGNPVSITSGSSSLTACDASSYVVGRFTLAGTSSVDLRIYTDRRTSSNGAVGSATPAGSTTGSEVYSTLLIWKVA